MGFFSLKKLLYTEKNLNLNTQFEYILLKMGEIVKYSWIPGSSGKGPIK